jgi:microcin C transport system substrate-binding protein
MKNLFLAFLLVCSAAFAEPSYVLSRFGQSKYPADFKYFSYVNPKAPKGGQIRLATVGTFDSLNKDSVKGIVVEGLLLVYDPLMKKSADDPYSWYGLIAEKAEIEKDYSAITFHLNPKAKFHDQSSITAEDVRFTIELLRDQGLPRYRQYFSRIQDIKIINPQTIKITFNKEGENYDPELPLIVANLRVLSKKNLEGKNFKEMGLTPILGSGPYKISTVDPGRSISYERVKDYWAADLPVNVGQHNFDIIKIDYYKNAQAQFQAFAAGEFDCFFEADQKQWKTAYNFAAVKDGRVKLVSAQHNRPVAVRTIIFNMRKPIFQDVRLRKALSYAFDFDTMNKMLFHGAYERMTSLFANTPLAHKGAASEAEKALLYPYVSKIEKDVLEIGYEPARTAGDGNQRDNLARAGELLTQAGWVIKNGKRIHEKTGEQLRLEFMIKDPRLEKLALAFKRSLALLGVELEVRLLDSVQYEGRVVEADFDMIAHTWANTLSPGNEQIYYFSTKMADVKGSSNYIGLKDPIAEELAIKVAHAKDLDGLITATRALDRYVLCQHYMIPVFYDRNMCWAYWQDRLEFPAYDPHVGTNAMEWWWAKASS